MTAMPEMCNGQRFGLNTCIPFCFATMKEPTIFGYFVNLKLYNSEFLTCVVH